jgi:ribulose 1,5-bisphosphate synthetase/thiazole synthase
MQVLSWSVLLLSLVIKMSVSFRILHQRMARFSNIALFASSEPLREQGKQSQQVKVAIVGGGLAGLSTAFHLLQKSPGCDITILDKAPVGTSGASAVAGG